MKIHINAPYYTMTKKFGLKMYYNTLDDKNKSNTIYGHYNYYDIHDLREYENDVPSNSNIVFIYLETGLLYPLSSEPLRGVLSCLPWKADLPLRGVLSCLLKK